MDAKKCTKALWAYLTDCFEREQILAGFQDCFENLEYKPEEISNEMIDSLSDEDASSLFFDMGYMALNELIGGDWGTWYEILEGMGFSADEIEFLSF